MREEENRNDKKEGRTSRGLPRFVFQIEKSVFGFGKFAVGCPESSWKKIIINSKIIIQNLLTPLYIFYFGKTSSPHLYHQIIDKMDGGQSVMETERIFSADQIVVHPELGR